MDYLKIVDNLRGILSGTFYTRFVNDALEYYAASARYASAEITSSPQIPLFLTELEGTRFKLLATAGLANQALTSNKPPLPQIPTEKKQLDGLVLELMSSLFGSRR